MSVKTALLFVLVYLQGCFSLNCQCGQRQTPKQNEVRQGGRWISKYEAHVNEFPWAALIKIGENNFCGGTLVNSRFVVTAAHCIDPRNPTSLTITLGEHDRSVSYESDSFKTVAIRAYNYPGYKNYTDKSLAFDVGIIELAKEVNFYSYPHIRPICMPDKGARYPTNSFGTVTGWGATLVKHCNSQGICKVDKGSFSDTLIKLDDVKLIGKARCSQSYKRFFPIREGSVCGLSKTGDSCNGDSGSGLVYTNPKTGQYELFGIVSYGAGCNSTMHGVKLPGIYADVRNSEIWNWIDGIISHDGQFCDSSPGITVHSPGPRQTESGSWGPWSSFSQCQGFGTIGKKRRERQCSHPMGRGCGRGTGSLFESQERPCPL